MKPKWQKQLTKAEIKHIKETTDSGTLAQFKLNRQHHAQMREEHPDHRDPCFECRHIALKLGIEEI